MHVLLIETVLVAFRLCMWPWKVKVKGHLKVKCSKVHKMHERTIKSHFKAILVHDLEKWGQGQFFTKQEVSLKWKWAIQGSQWLVFEVPSLKTKHFMGGYQISQTRKLFFSKDIFLCGFCIMYCYHSNAALVNAVCELLRYVIPIIWLGNFRTHHGDLM